MVRGVIEVPTDKCEGVEAVAVPAKNCCRSMSISPSTLLISGTVLVVVVLMLFSLGTAGGTCTKEFEDLVPDMVGNFKVTFDHRVAGIPPG